MAQGSEVTQCFCHGDPSCGKSTALSVSRYPRLRIGKVEWMRKAKAENWLFWSELGPLGSDIVETRPIAQSQKRFFGHVTQACLFIINCQMHSLRLSSLFLKKKKKMRYSVIISISWYYPNRWMA
jgi:hypothetical protein